MNLKVYKKLHLHARSNFVIDFALVNLKYNTCCVYLFISYQPLKIKIEAAEAKISWL